MEANYCGEPFYRNLLTFLCYVITKGNGTLKMNQGIKKRYFDAKKYIPLPIPKDILLVNSMYGCLFSYKEPKYIAVVLENFSTDISSNIFCL